MIVAVFCFIFRLLCYMSNYYVFSISTVNEVYFFQLGCQGPKDSEKDRGEVGPQSGPTSRQRRFSFKPVWRRHCDRNIAGDQWNRKSSQSGVTTSYSRAKSSIPKHFFDSYLSSSFYIGKLKFICGFFSSSGLRTLVILLKLIIHIFFLKAMKSELVIVQLFF